MFHILSPDWTTCSTSSLSCTQAPRAWDSALLTMDVQNEQARPLTHSHASS